MCWPAFNKLLGTSKRSTTNAKSLQLDLRRSIDGLSAPRDGPQAQKVHEFFLGFYRSSAEPMPHEHYMVKGCVDKNIEIDEPLVLRCSGDEDENVDVWNPDRPITSDLVAFLGEDIGAAKRYMANNTLTSIYWLMASQLTPEGGEMDDEQVPSWSTFHRVWATTWHKFLGFRKKSQHADCRHCFKFRERLHQCFGVHARVDLAREWRLHLRAAYHDRMIYWWCRYASRHNLDVLTIIIDSMDKAKLAWPQWPWGTVDKTLERFRRPRVVLTAAMAHGYGTFLFVADEDLSHGSDAFCDVLARVLEFVWRRCRETGRNFPRHLVIQSDNTTAQAKNTYVAMFLAFLVSKYKFTTTNLFFLQVGHTHEDVGAQLVIRSVSICLNFWCLFPSGVFWCFRCPWKTHNFCVLMFLPRPTLWGHSRVGLAPEAIPDNRRAPVALAACLD